MYLNTNMAALNAWSALQNTESQMNTVLQRLSTGFRINNAADNPSGLAISQQMQSQINGLNQGQTNAQAGASLLQTADGSLGHIESILQSMRSLASEASTATQNSSDLTDLQAEMNQYAKEITQISNTTQFNKLSLLSGAYGGVGPAQQFQIGANQGETLSVAISAADASSLGVLGNAATIGAAGTNPLALQPGSVTNVGSGFAAGTYSVHDSFTQASTSAVTASNTGSGASTSAVSGNYTGTSSTNYVVKVSQVTGGAASQVQVSTDGGITYGAAQAITSGTAFSVGNGLKVALTAASTPADTVGETYSFTATPASNTVTLQDSGSNTVATGSFNGIAATNLLLTGNSNQGTLNVNIDPTASSGINATTSIGTAGTATDYSQTVKIALDGAAATTTGNGQLKQADWASANSGVNIESQGNAQAALTSLSNAIATINQQRANIGAWQNRLQFASSQDQTANLNLTNAQAGIRDTNMALQMSNMAKDQVLQQSGIAMLSQANQIPTALLKLLG